MWIVLLLIELCVSLGRAEPCERLLSDCKSQSSTNWIRCYEEKAITCEHRSRFIPRFVRMTVNKSDQADLAPTSNHRVRIPSSALLAKQSRVFDKEVVLVASVIDSALFKQTPPKGRHLLKPLLTGEVLGGSVLFVKAENYEVRNLVDPINLFFKHEKVKNGDCVFWEESESDPGTGQWLKDGCETKIDEDEFICSCNHLSFFAVLVNPDLEVPEEEAVKLSYITYMGSTVSAISAFISLFIYIHLHRKRPEKALGIHMQLTSALVCLHLSFLTSTFWAWLLVGVEDSWVCKGLGLCLHWALLATFTWTALEGFHLYLLLVRVFNIYVRRYVLKLSVVGWGFPTLVTMICGISGVYGKYTLDLNTGRNQSSPSELCWMRSQFPHRRLVGFVTVGYLGLVVLCNCCMLAVVLLKLWGLRGGKGAYESSSDWKKMNQEKRSRLWKDCVTVVGLSFVLGLPWGLAGFTYISYVTLPGIYLFTMLNSLQGLFMFLWSVALTCKSHSERDSSVQDPSTQRMTTSFNN